MLVLSARFAMPLAILLALAVSSIFALTEGHSFMSEPAVRGGLKKTKMVSTTIDRSAPSDGLIHFPAGDKSRRPGSGVRSQKAAAGNVWTPFEPLKPGFRWRADVCGDPLKGRHAGDHRFGGRYYWPRSSARIVRTYRPGSVIDVSIKVVAHHNGFMELHLCDVSKCPGGKDISRGCFANACVQLKRAANARCDGGMDKRCAPIDRNHPGRWYLPCRSRSAGKGFAEPFGPGTIKYQLPAGFSCRHCVLHWYHAAANSCNPPGVIEYFRGPDRPRNWGSCPGQAGARGGAALNRKVCMGSRFTEEYYQCADIAIGGRAA